MSPKSAAFLWAGIILSIAFLTIMDVLPNRGMAWILPMLALGSVMHMNALRRNQATGDAGCGC